MRESGDNINPFIMKSSYLQHRLKLQNASYLFITLVHIDLHIIDINKLLVITITICLLH